MKSRPIFSHILSSRNVRLFRLVSLFLDDDGDGDDGDNDDGDEA